ncbi:Cna B-type domain-containing protein [Peptostreptococcus stomatis]|uniref:Cna B-type domain-containing protein n=1 Tax=Peptostreptococcus stomatis TaxID=341694 RepID=UPI003F9F6F71
MKKFMNIFLVFAMIFSMVFQSSGRVSAQVFPNNVIAGASIVDTNNQPITKPIGAWQNFRVNVNYKLPDNVLQNGDKTILTLPVGFAKGSPDEFNVTDGSDIVAKGKLIDGNPVKLELTYTNYVDTHSNMQGSFYFNIQINGSIKETEENIPLTLTVQGSGAVVQAGVVKYKPQKANALDIIKGSWMDSGDKTVGHHKISVNQKNSAMEGVVLADTLLNPKVEYVKGSFQVFEGKWVLNSEGTDIRLTEEVDVTGQYLNKINIQDKHFTVAIGNIPAGKGLQFRYKTKILYEPVVGEVFNNKAELDAMGTRKDYTASYKISDAGGSGEGYVYKIKVKKINEKSEPLSDAKFSVIRDRNGAEVGTITTGADGTGELGGLVKDKYRLVEIEAPQGYKKLTEEEEKVNIVKESDFSETDRTASKTIKNKPETVDVTVTKAWVGPIGNTATVQLIKGDGPTGTVIEEKVLNAGGNWKHIFKDLRKYEANGTTPIEYTVKEKDVPQGYESKVTGSVEDGFKITNTNIEKTEVKVKKKWVGPIGNSATVQLIKGDAPNETVIEEKVLNAGVSWEHTFTGLDKYEANGTPIKYKVKEKDVPQGYKSEVTGSMEDGFTITNTNIEKRDVKVLKEWEGDVGNPVVFQLIKRDDPTNTVIAEKELNAGGNWEGKFTGQPKYNADGSEIAYKIVEKNVPIGYEPFYYEYSTGILVVKNIQKTIDVKVEKKWENVTGNKPTIKLQLLKNGQAEGAPVEIENGTTEYTWPGLKEADPQGQEYTYTVKEVDENSNYIQLEGNQYKVTYGGDHKTGLTVTNKKLTPWTPLVPATRDIKVVKNWKDKAGNNITAPVDKVEVELYKDGVATGKKLELKKADGWKATFEKLPVSATSTGPVHKYTVKEVGETANTISFNGTTYNVIYKGDMKDGLTVVNEKKPSSPGGGTGGITPPNPGVIGGGDRIETAIKISRRFYDKAKTVIVVRHDLFPDSMTASVLAKLKDAPILLNPTDKLDPRVGAEIKRLGAEEVIIVGGPDSVSERVREELKVYDKDKNVERVAGVDRYGTSEMVARRVTGITGKKYTGVVASGQVFPDALSVGTFASREAYPILLVKKDTVPYQIERAIKDLDISKTYIAGGTSTIFKSTEAKLPRVLERMAGKDRYETSVAIAKSKFEDSKEAFIASGEEFADALVISPISGKYNKPTLLASRNKNTNAVVKKYIQDAGLTSIIAIGGEKYLPYSVLLNLVGK